MTPSQAANSLPWMLRWNPLSCVLRSAAPIADKPESRRYVALIAMVAFSVGLVGFAHEHPGDEALDEHSCALCQVQHSVLEVASPAGVNPVAAPPRWIAAEEPGSPPALAFRQSPPLRGPPVH